MEYAIRPSTVLEVDYVGNRSEHIDTGTEMDIPMLATPTVPVNCGLPTGCVTINTSTNAAQRVPIIGTSIGGYNMTSNTGDGEYDAIEATLRKRLSHGLQFSGSYTYGRCFTDVAGTSFTAGQGGTVNWDVGLNDRYLARSNCGYNRAQRLVINYTYQLPEYRLGKGFAGQMLSGWTVSGITTAQSGQPLTFTDPNGAGAYGFVTSGAEMCPGFTYGQILTSGSTVSRLNNYFNLAALADTSVTKGSTSCALPIVGAFPSPGPGLPASPGATGFGNIAQNILAGPGQFNWDVSLLKQTRVGGIRENAILEFRAQAFNTFNHPQFGQPNTTVTSSAFGTINTTSTGPRIMQLALRYMF